MTERSY